MALDVLIRHQPSMLYRTIGRSFYTSEGSRSLGGGAEAWQGYYLSARPTLGRMIINIDVCATAFYESGPLIQMVAKILERPLDHLRRGLVRGDIQKLEKRLKGLQIRVTHRGEQASRRKYKITALTPGPTSSINFDQDGRQISIAAYFYQTYRRRLDFQNLPCVIVKQDIFLPIEICEVVEGRRYPRKLDGEQTRNMIAYACERPNSRANKILRGLNALNFRGNEHLQKFGIRISNEMTTVNARILPVPTIVYHASSKEPKVRPNDGVWSLRDKKVFTGATLGSWSVLVFGSPNELGDGVIRLFVRELVNNCQEKGMNIPNRNPPISYVNMHSTTEENLMKAWLEAGNTAKQKPQLILCVLLNIKTDLYPEIKRVSDTIIGVQTQCVQAKHTNRPNKQYLANLCLKINVKLGGMNSHLTELPFVDDQPTIIMGADVTHPPPGIINYKLHLSVHQWILGHRGTPHQSEYKRVEPNGSPILIKDNSQKFFEMKRNS
ncbi:6595_t:CDS:2 [Acaulospora colombiana]|uniref:6595_t:CDS:1 n=1 Tax=Acaulospora colombiana TaxID=27376 RepID=A0ACA9M8I9_9GLOM|nr:6595_t:CDS:2 [Acaulospora colombiana]